MLIKQSATAYPLTFLLLDAVTGAAATGKTATVTISKAGGSFGAVAGAVTEIGNGMYKVAGNATDTNTLGPLELYATATGCADAHKSFEVVAFDPQVANLAANVTQIAGSSADANSLGGLASDYSSGAFYVATDFDGNPLATVANQLRSMGIGRSWYVAKTGNDSTGSGTPSSPYLTIAKAVQMASSGDKVCIGDGTYTEQIAHGDAEKALSFEGQSADRCTVTYSGAGAVVSGYSSPGVTYRHLTIAATGDCSPAFDVGDSSDVLIEHCVVTGGVDTILVSEDGGAERLTVRKCRVDSHQDAISLFDGSGHVIEDTIINTDCTNNSGANLVSRCVYINGADAVTLRRCTINATRANSASQDAFGVWSQGAWVSIEDCPQIRARITNASSSGNAVAIYDGASSATRVAIKNNQIGTSTAGSGASRDLSFASGTCFDAGSTYDITKVHGTSPVVVKADDRDGAAVAKASVVGTPAGASLAADIAGVSTDALDEDAISAIISQSSKIIITAPIDGSSMTLVQGDAYLAAQGTQITLTKASGETGWPTTVSTLHFSCWPSDALIAEDATSTSTGVDDVALTSVTNSGGVLDLTAVQTTALVQTRKSGRYEYAFVANKGSNQKTVRLGVLKVLRGDSN